ncbi:MAG: AAA family ATPase [Pleomorphochaeta sp.]
MLLNMSIANFKSVKDTQTISFEALRDKRFSDSKIFQVNDTLSLIKSAAIIGPNGAGKSSFVRALESLKSIICASDEVENPLQVLSGTSFAYTREKNTPCTITIRFLLEKGNLDNIDEEPSIIGIYSFSANNKKITHESLYFVFNRSKKLMFERSEVVDPLADEDSPISYKYRFGKMYRGEKKRLIKKIDEKHSFLSSAAIKGSETTTPVKEWFENNLNILPMGVSAISEKYIMDQITAHPDWVQQLINFLWALDITDIKNIQIMNNRLVFSHTNVMQSYATYYSLESLSLRRLCLIGIAFFESFIQPKTIIIDDFGMLLHPYVLKHIIEIFEDCNKTTYSQLLAVDCNPALLIPGLLRRDGVYFAQKNEKSETVYYSLADFRFSRSRDLTSEQYMHGAFGALPLLSDFYFINKEEEEEK